MSSRFKRMETSVMICSECGKSFPIMRNRGQRRKIGHIKDLWCPYCKKDRKFIERMEEM